MTTKKAYRIRVDLSKQLEHDLGGLRAVLDMLRYDGLLKLEGLGWISYPAQSATSAQMSVERWHSYNIPANVESQEVCMWVLSIEHKHGTTTYLCDERETAELLLKQWVFVYWDEIPEWTEAPDGDPRWGKWQEVTPDDVDLYFEYHDCESYTLDESLPMITRRMAEDGVIA